METQAINDLNCKHAIMQQTCSLLKNDYTKRNPW